MTESTPGGGDRDWTEPGSLLRCPHPKEKQKDVLVERLVGLYLLQR